jgi:hypothetical protein
VLTLSVKFNWNLTSIFMLTNVLLFNEELLAPDLIGLAACFMVSRCVIARPGPAAHRVPRLDLAVYFATWET